MLNREDYRKFVNPAWPMINTNAYARIESAKGTTVWRAVCVYHLPGNINGGQHVIFCDTLNTAGTWADDNKNLRIGYTWSGKTDGPLYRPFEKRPPEPRAQVDLYKNQVTTVWVDDPRYPSDRVVGLHSAVADTQDGNTLFHNSFVVLWQLLSNAVIIPPDKPVDPPPDPNADELIRLRAENLALKNKVLYMARSIELAIDTLKVAV